MSKRLNVYKPNQPHPHSIFLHPQPLSLKTLPLKRKSQKDRSLYPIISDFHSLEQKQIRCSVKNNHNCK